MNAIGWDVDLATKIYGSKGSSKVEFRCTVEGFEDFLKVVENKIKYKARELGASTLFLEFGEAEVKYREHLIKMLESLGYRVERLKFKQPQIRIDWWRKE